MYPADFQENYLRCRHDRKRLEEIYGVNDRTIRKYAEALRKDLLKQGKRVRLYYDKDGIPYPECIDEIPELKPRSIAEVITDDEGTIRVYGDAVVISDVHIPFHDMAIIQRVAEYGKKIDTLVINGDTFNFDHLSSFPCKQPDAGWKVEKKTAQDLFIVLCEAFDKIIINEGNHDRRIESGTNYNFDIEDIIDIIVPERHRDKIYLSDKDYCIINDTYRPTHGTEYSRRHGSKAIMYSKLYNLNVIAAHSHMLGRYTIDEHDIDSKGNKNINLIAIDGGHCCDEKRFKYKTRKSTGHGVWCQGFVVIQDNKDRIISPFEPVEKWHKNKSVEFYKPC